MTVHRDPPATDTSEPGGEWTYISWKYAVDGDLPDPVVEEMRRAHQVKTLLLDAARQHQDTVAAIWAASPQYVSSSGRLERARDAVRELAARARAERFADARGRARPETAPQLALARAEAAAAKDAFGRVRDELGPALKPQFTAALDHYHAVVKALYRQAVDSGLYWATYNAVVADHWKAVAATRAARRAGRPAALRARAWDGTGTLTVTLLRLAGEAPRSPAVLASADGRYRNLAQLRPWMPPAAWQAMPGWARHRLKPGTVSIRIGAGDHACMVTLPVVVHRMLPADADVTRIRVTRTRLGTGYRSWILVLARIPLIPPRPAGPAVAVHAGWRVLPDKSIRVAVIAGAGQPPAHLAAAGLVRDQGTWAEVVIPARWRDLDKRIKDTHHRRVRDLAALRDWLSRWLADHPDSAAALDPDEALALWAAGGRFANAAVDAFAAAAIRLRQATPAGCGEPAARLWAWRRTDRRLHEWEANERDQLIARRNDAWRNVAAWVTAAAGLVVMDEWNARYLTRSSGADEDDTPQQRAARANRALAAPFALRAKITLAAGRRGVPAELVELPAPAVHHPCGTPLDKEARAASVMVWCGTCDLLADQDVDALGQILAGSRLAARRGIPALAAER